MDTNKKIVNDILETMFNNEYKTSYSKESIQLINPGSVYYTYLVNGFKDSSGGYYPFMTELCLRTNPKHVVELGNREGLGVISIFEGIKQNNDVIFSTIDIIRDLRFVPNYMKNDKRVKIIFGNVLDDKIVEEVKGNGPIDIILLDTVHTEQHLENEWNKYEPLFNDNAIILIDDIYYDSKYKFFDKIKYDKLVDKRLHITGLGIVFYER